MHEKLNPLSQLNRSEEMSDTSFPELVSLRDFIDNFAILSNIAATRVRLTLIEVI
jgi:hypothetical protein